MATPRKASQPRGSTIQPDGPIGNATPSDTSRADRPAANYSRVADASVEPAPDRGPDEAQIRARAYERFIARGDGPGNALDDWLNAERDCRSQAASSRLRNSADPAEPLPPS